MKIIITISFILLGALSVFSQTKAEIIAPLTYLRKLPSSTAEKVKTLQKGDIINIEQPADKNGWFFVSTSDKTFKGWLSGNTFRVVENAEMNSVNPVVVTNEKPKNATPPPPAKTVAKKSTEVKTTRPAIASTKPVALAVKPTPKVESKPIETPKTEDPNAPVIDNEVLKIDSVEVNLNVRVVDANNRFVSNLDESQFKVYEDGVLQPITSLTLTEVPAINALVIDNSRSLRSQLGKIIDAGKTIISTNRVNDESAVIRFISREKIEVAQDFTKSKSLLNNALDNLFVEGGQTAIIDAVYMAAEKVEAYQKSANKEDIRLRAIVLVSDGDDRNSLHREQELIELLRKSNVQIYVIGFVNNLSNEPDTEGINRQEKAKNFLVRLGQETGGKVYFPNSIDELPKIATEISGELRSQYTISYSPTNENFDGTFRKIKVEVADGANNEKRTSITRAGRTATVNKTDK